MSIYEQLQNIITTAQQARAEWREQQIQQVLATGISLADAIGL